MFGLNNIAVAAKFFLVIAGELVLIFVAVSFLIGVLMEYLPPERIRGYLSNRPSWIQYVMGAGLGSATPFCSCSTVPITAGLLKGGVPFGPVMAFLFSSPVLNPVIIALLLSLLGYKVTAVYIVITFLGSMTAAALLSKMRMEGQVKALVGLESSCCGQEAKTAGDPLQPAAPPAACCASDAMPPVTLIPLSALQSPAGCCAVTLDESGGSKSTGVPFKEKMKKASLSAIDTFKGVFWYLLLGAGIGAVIYGFFPQDLVVRLAGPGNPVSIPVAAAIGVPMYIRAGTIIPIGAALVGKGMGVGTVLALIIGGAGASIPELIILGSMFRKKLIFAFVLNVLAVAVITGYVVDFLIY